MNVYKEANRTRVYISDTGYICIGQDNPFYGDQLVCLTPDQADWIVSKINESMIEATDKFAKDEEEDATEA
jgi:hypothetical protein